MNKIAVLPTQENSPLSVKFSDKQIEILKNSICKGVSDEEFQIFLMACTKTQLDPFMRQIYAVKRKTKKPDGTWGETMTIQTGIDGYRLIAERTEKYAPGPETTYVHDEQGKLISATAYIKKLTKDGTWHIVSASAYLDEYCQTTLDRTTGEKKPTGMWVNMPRTMLAKCAEAQALRKAFPAEMSGVYTQDEMSQSVSMPTISSEQALELEMILGDCDEKYRNWVYESIKKKYQAEYLSDLPSDSYEKIKSAVVKNMEETRSKQPAPVSEEAVCQG